MAWLVSMYVSLFVTLSYFHLYLRNHTLKPIKYQKYYQNIRNQVHGPTTSLRSMVKPSTPVRKLKMKIFESFLQLRVKRQNKCLGVLRQGVRKNVLHLNNNQMVGGGAVDLRLGDFKNFCVISNVNSKSFKFFF